MDEHQLDITTRGSANSMIQNIAKTPKKLSRSIVFAGLVFLLLITMIACDTASESLEKVKDTDAFEKAQEAIRDRTPESKPSATQSRESADRSGGRNAQVLQSGQVSPKQVRGGTFPSIKQDLLSRLNDNEKSKPYYVPDGPIRGKTAPEGPKYVTKLLNLEPPIGSGDTQAPLSFEEYDEIDDANPVAHLLNPEPSVAENGPTVMTTGNSWVSLSEDGGQNFTSVNPTTIFPEDYGGFCCDQVLQYVPQNDMFVWLLQYKDVGGTNAIRIAVQTTQGVRNSNGTAWTYWDFTNVTFAPIGELDYNDMSFSNSFLYWTSSIGGGANRYVVRIPLEELQAMGTVNFQFTESTDARWSHLTQNGRNGVYWANHEDNSTMMVYSMMDADNFFSWREVPINSWPNATITSTAADGNDWLQDASWKTFIRAGAISGDSAYFAWMASSGGGFPEPHIQIVEISTSSFTLKNQTQVWNPDFAFGFPYFETNAKGELGMIVAFGGGKFEASSGVGVLGDNVIYYPGLSATTSRTNYGHYHTARRSGSESSKWVGAGVTRKKDGSILPYYIRFSR